MFEYLKKPVDVTSHNLYTGTTDFGNLAQFNQFEGGYAALFVIKIPAFLEKLAETNTQYKYLINQYKHILEREFKNLDGLSDMDTEVQQISDGINEMDIITQVKWQAGTDFSMTYQEKSGSPITRVHELYLTGLRDPRAGQVKHYHGLIEKGLMEAGFENEVFEFLYVVTDNTMRNVEKAYLIVSAQIKNAQFGIYEYTKGSVEFKEVTVNMHGVPITNATVNDLAQNYIAWLNSGVNNIKFNSSEFDYSSIEDIKEYDSERAKYKENNQ